MNRKTHLGRPSAIAAALAAFLTAAVSAQNQQVTVQALRLPTIAAEALAEVTILDRAVLDQSEARTLAEVLAGAPGIQISANGGLGKPSAVFIRGQEGRHTLLLVDGVRVGSATLNQPSLDNLPLEAIERIEIVRGPMSSLYGSNAMGGVINVVTRQGAPGLRGNARLSAGSHGYGLLGGGVRFGNEGLSLSAQVQQLATDGHSATNPQVPFGQHNPDADGFRQKAATLRGTLTLGRGWQLQGLLLDARGRTQYDDGLGEDALARLVNRVQALALEGRPMTPWRTRLHLGRSHDAYDTLRSASPWAELGAITTDQTQLAWENQLTLPVGELLLLLERVRQAVDKPAPTYEVTQRRISAAAVAWSARLGAHRVQASLRRDRNSQFGSQSVGALAWAMVPAPGWQLGASAGEGWIAPSFNDLYYPGFSNPALQPEQGRQAEAFAQWSPAGQQLRLTVYRQRWNGYISGGPQPANLPRVAVDGATLSWQAQLGTLGLQLALDTLDARNETEGSPNRGKRLARRAPQTLKAGVDWTLGAWRLAATAQAAAHRYDDGANTARLAGYGVVDLSADWALTPGWRLGLRLNNAGNRSYETAQGYNSAPREGFVTLRWAPR